MNETVLVYRIGQDPIVVPSERCIFTDRTRIEEGLCPRKRYIRYELDGIGYVTQGSSNEDLVIGGATHEGLDLLLQGGTLDKSLQVAEDYFRENISYSDYLLHEQQDALGWDGCNLAKAFIYAFNSCYLPQLLDKYKVLEIEEEINWLVRETEDSKYIVMMSRPDGVLRNKETGKLYHLSHKTTKEFYPVTIEKFKMDIQRFSESFAIWAKYEEPPEGTLYNYFIKNRKYEDKDLGIERYNSGLIHPYMQRMGPGGTIEPEMLSFSYEWQELEGHLLKNRRLGKGWEKVSIYNEMDYLLYLQWLETQIVPRGRDYLKESVVGLIEEPFNQNYAERWLEGIAYSERIWSERVDYIKGIDTPFQNNPNLDREFPLESSQCFLWNNKIKCPYILSCWSDNTIDVMIREGVLVPRTPNHLIELRKKDVK